MCLACRHTGCGFSAVSRAIGKNLPLYCSQGSLEYRECNAAIPLVCLCEQWDKPPHIVENLAETGPKKDDVNAWLKKQMTCLMLKWSWEYRHMNLQNLMNSLMQLQARNEIQRRKAHLKAIVSSASILPQNGVWVALFSVFFYDIYQLIIFDFFLWLQCIENLFFPECKLTSFLPIKC